MSYTHIYNINNQDWKFGRYLTFVCVIGLIQTYDLIWYFIIYHDMRTHVLEVLASHVTPDLTVAILVRPSPLPISILSFIEVSASWCSWSRASLTANVSRETSLEITLASYSCLMPPWCLTSCWWRLLFCCFLSWASLCCFHQLWQLPAVIPR